MTGVDRFLFFYDRDRTGLEGARRAQEAVSSSGFDREADVFDWDRFWPSPVRGDVGIPSSITDPAEFSIGQLQWLRHEGIL